MSDDSLWVSLAVLCGRKTVDNMSKGDFSSIGYDAEAKCPYYLKIKAADIIQQKIERLEARLDNQLEMIRLVKTYTDGYYLDRDFSRLMAKDEELAR